MGVGNYVWVLWGCFLGLLIVISFCFDFDLEWFLLCEVVLLS